MDSENVYGTSFRDSMIRKFSKNGPLKMNIAIDPINPVAAMVPNKSSTKNTATESQTPSSGKSILQHLVFFLVYMSRYLLLCILPIDMNAVFSALTISD